MKNQKEIEKHLRDACLKASKKQNGEENIRIAKEIWEKSQGNSLEAVTIRTKIFSDLRFCFSCGEPLPGFRAFKNGIPHCLLPCCV